mgnify:CR=1 FL=1
MRILIIDDDPALTRQWERTLRGAGHAVTVANTVPAAMYVAMTQPFDLVLTELFVDEAATVSLCHYLAISQPITSVVIVTGSTVFTGGEVQRLASNIELVLQKPAPLRDLAATADYLADLLPGRRLAGIRAERGLPYTPRAGL